jgi:outer membrane protein OmpA-like peptidoglycan-associated protein
MNFRLVLAAATCLSLPFVAHAQPVTGPYISLGAGTSIADPVNASSYQPAILRGDVTYTAKNQFRPSYAGAGAMGYGFGNGFRVELGGDYLRNTRHAADAAEPGAPTFHADVTGGENTYGPMVNVLYDIPLGLPVFPYVGVGAGYQWTQINSDFMTPYTNTVAKNYSYSGTRGSFAYDLIAGAAYPLPFVPGLSLTGEYRFMQLTGSRNFVFHVPLGGLLPPSAFSKDVKVGQASSNTFLVGLRYQLFNAPAMAPAPAPVAAPAPAAARTYLVFFDWDKYNLTPRATQIIAQAASDSKTQATTTLDVSGYTDTSGTPVYNQGLSLRRAKAVAAKLVVDGVPAAEIEIHAYGETHLLVPTGPGVREPQNRRVEIVLN